MYVDVSNLYVFPLLCVCLCVSTALYFSVVVANEKNEKNKIK